VSSWVLDASAILALSNQEPGADEVERAIGDGAAVSAVNLSEAVAKLSADRADAMVREFLDVFQLQVVPFDAEAAYQTGFLRNATKHMGLSLGDRACLVLARQLSVPVLTTDRAWQRLQLDITVRLIR
jgi:ribonuclease VapC